MKKIVILSGFSGAGKSTVGGILSKKYGWSWVDVDAEVEQAAGKSIAELVRVEGEQRFRELEAEMVRLAFEREPDVISLGGGALLAAATRELVERCGVLVCLNVSAATSAKRVYRSKQVRPLLEETRALTFEEVEARIGELMRKRSGLYDTAQVTILTDELTPKMVAQRVVEEVRQFGVLPDKQHLPE